ERRMYGTSPLSLDAPLPGDDNAVMGDLFSQEQGLGVLFGQSFSFEDEAVTSTSLDVGLAKLPPDNPRLCAALVSSSIDQLAASGRGARATRDRHLNPVRMALLAHRGDPVWDTSRAPCVIINRDMLPYIAPPLLLTQAQFGAQVGQSAPGLAIEYQRGF